MGEYNYREVWKYAMDQIRIEYEKSGQKDEFLLWFNMKYLEDDINTITVSVASDFLWQQMKRKGNIEKICDKIKELTGQGNIEIKPVIENTSISRPDDANSDNSEPESRNPKKAADAGSADSVNVKTQSKNSKYNREIFLKPEFTFDSFVAGENSNFAYNAAIAVADNPGKAYNPILFYGGVGLGKTHLMQAIGNKILEKDSDIKKICYIQAESFTNEFTASIASKTINKFKSKYRNLDVLLLDDIHFLQGKEATQEELFYTFNALSNRNSQMVFTCDRPINELKNIADRLKNRFSNGLCIDLQPPNYETRKAILLKKLERINKNIPDDIIDYIAKNVETNVRDLESALTKIIGYSDLINSNLNLNIVQQQLRDIFSQPSAGNISIETIQKVVAENYQISVPDIKSKKRDKKFVVPRQIAIYIARDLTEYAFTELGNEFGGRDHSTIMHAYDKICEQIKIDSTLNSKIQLLKNEIKDYKK